MIGRIQFAFGQEFLVTDSGGYARKVRVLALDGPIALMEYRDAGRFAKGIA